MEAADIHTEIGLNLGLDLDTDVNTSTDTDIGIDMDVNIKEIQRFTCIDIEILIQHI